MLQTLPSLLCGKYLVETISLSDADFRFNCRWASEWWLCLDWWWIKLKLCTFIPVNGVWSITLFRISNHRVITKYRGDNRYECGDNQQDCRDCCGRSVILSLLQNHLKKINHCCVTSGHKHLRCIWEQLCHDEWQKWVFEQWIELYNFPFPAPTRLSACYRVLGAKTDIRWKKMLLSTLTFYGNLFYTCSPCWTCRGGVALKCSLAAPRLAPWGRAPVSANCHSSSPPLPSPALW